MHLTLQETLSLTHQGKTRQAKLFCVASWMLLLHSPGQVWQPRCLCAERHSDPSPWVLRQRSVFCWCSCTPSVMNKSNTSIRNETYMAVVVDSEIYFCLSYSSVKCRISFVIAETLHLQDDELCKKLKIFSNFIFYQHMHRRTALRANIPKNIPLLFKS